MIGSSHSDPQKTAKHDLAARVLPGYSFRQKSRSASMAADRAKIGLAVSITPSFASSWAATSCYHGSIVLVEIGVALPQCCAVTVIRVLMHSICLENFDDLELLRPSWRDEEPIPCTSYRLHPCSSQLFKGIQRTSERSSGYRTGPLRGASRRLRGSNEGCLCTRPYTVTTVGLAV